MRFGLCEFGFARARQPQPQPQPQQSQEVSGLVYSRVAQAEEKPNPIQQPRNTQEKSQEPRRPASGSSSSSVGSRPQCVVNGMDDGRTCVVEDARSPAPNAADASDVGGPGTDSRSWPALATFKNARLPCHWSCTSAIYANRKVLCSIRPGRAQQQQEQEGREAAGAGTASRERIQHSGQHGDQKRGARPARSIKIRCGKTRYLLGTLGTGYAGCRMSLVSHDLLTSPLL